MGRIKTALIKRTAEALIEKSPESFTPSFEQVKKALGNVLPSKRMRNVTAGYIARLKRREQERVAKELKISEQIAQ